MALGFDFGLDDEEEEPDTDWRSAARALLASLSTPRTFSKAGLNALKEREGGFYEEPYGDVKKLAIGYGFNTWKGKPVAPGLKITQQEADDEFQRQIDTDYGKNILNSLKVPTTQNQRDALLSVGYNTGSQGAVQRLIAMVNAGQQPTENDFLASATVGGVPNEGLRQRRRAEYAQFGRPDDQQLEPGNIDLFKQPRVQNPDGSSSTVDSFSVNIDGREVLLPTVLPDGRHVTPDEAVQVYKQTGRHLGIFNTPEAATAYAQQLHEDYAAGKYDDWREQARGLLDWMKTAPLGSEWDVVSEGMSAPIGEPPLIPPSAADIEKEIIRGSPAT